MQIKISSLLFCLFVTFLLGANTTPDSFHPIKVDLVSCETPPPAIFEVVEIGSTWVSLTWGPSSPLSQYRIRTYRSSDDFLLNTTTTLPGAMNATIANLPSETECYSVINTICPDGSNSPLIKNSGDYFLPILELLVNYQAVPNGESGCTIVGINTCSFSINTVTYFNISLDGLNPRKFSAKVTPNQGLPDSYQIFLENENNSLLNPFKFYCNQNVDPSPSCGTNLVAVTYVQNGAEVPVGSISLSRATNLGNLNASLLTLGGSSFKITEIKPRYGGRPGGPTVYRGDFKDGAIAAAKASPNPFTETLDVFIPKSAAQQINIQLFNLAGQQVLHQQFPGDQAQYSLSTESLAPGFYLLHIEADGEVQTLKVVKSE